LRSLSILPEELLAAIRGRKVQIITVLVEFKDDLNFPLGSCLLAEEQGIYTAGEMVGGGSLGPPCFVGLVEFEGLAVLDKYLHS
jgi:hypothetical protein